MKKYVRMVSIILISILFLSAITRISVMAVDHKDTGTAEAEEIAEFPEMINEEENAEGAENTAEGLESANSEMHEEDVTDQGSEKETTEKSQEGKNSDVQTETLDSSIQEENGDPSAVSQMPEEEPAADNTDTIISQDPAEGIAQIQTIIPDYNFAEAVYTALSENDCLGNPDDYTAIDDSLKVKAVIANYQGEINAGGYGTAGYKATCTKFDLKAGTQEDIVQTFSTKNEAQAFLDSFIPDIENQIAYYKAPLEEVKGLKPESELIKSIQGIEWLRQASLIDITYNQITDFSPFDMEHLKELTPDVGLVSNSPKKWFGSPGKNTEIRIWNNPVIQYPRMMGGRLLSQSLAAHEFEVSPPPIIIVKGGPQNVYSFNVDIPLIKCDTERMKVDKSELATNILSSTVEGAAIDYIGLTDSVIPFNVAGYSGKIKFVVGGDKESRITIYTVSPSDSATVEEDTFKFLFEQTIRVYNEIKVEEPPKSNSQITLHKVVSNTETPVEGAVYKLYRAVMENGSYVPGELVDDTSYITGADGNVVIDKQLDIGDYCMVESEAPEGFVLDQTPIGFSLGSGVVTLTGGDQSVEPTTGDQAGQIINAGINSAFIDRYSPEIQLTVTPDEGMELDYIAVTYLDRMTQEFKTQQFASAQEAQDWINTTGKGSEETPGEINGSVSVQAVYKASRELTAGNQRKTSDLTFRKISQDDGQALSKVKFHLSCSHVHDDSCGGTVDPAACTHPHNDSHSFSDSKGCTWSMDAESDDQGMVSFKGLISGNYVLKETAANDGFILPEGVWNVEVDAEKDSVNVSADKDSDGKNMPEFIPVTGKDYAYEVENKKSGYPFSFIKTDAEDNNIKLQGAEFELYFCSNKKADHVHDEIVSKDTKDCWALLQSAQSDEHGLVDFGQIPAGEYMLVETKAPMGYERPLGQWILRMDETGEVTAAAAGKPIPPAFQKEKNADGSIILMLGNRKIVTMPLAGGNGVFFFWIAGIGFLSAAVMLWRKRKTV